MKSKLLFLVNVTIFTLIVSGLYAQKQTVTISGGKVVEGELFKKRYYFLPEFGEGVLKYVDGTIFKAVLNIDVFKQCVSVINKKDTITISDNNNVDAVLIGKNAFRKIKNFYYQILFENDKLSIGFYKVLKISAESSAGAYGTTTNNAAVSSLNSVSSNNQIENLSTPVKYNFTYEERYCIITPDKNVSALNKKKLLSFYPDKKELIENFIKDKKIDFSKNSDIVPLINFIIGL